MINNISRSRPVSNTQLRLIKGSGIEPTPLNAKRSLEEMLRYGAPWVKGLERDMILWKIRNFPNYYRGMHKLAIARLAKIRTFWGELVLVKIDGQDGNRIDFGIVGYNCVTDNGVDFISDAFMNSVEAEIMNYHGIGTGTTVDTDATQTALTTELTTEYNPNSTRATGTQSQPANGQYRSVGTNTLDSGTPAVTEHGLFSATSAGVMFDRTKFSAINLVGANADALQSTYTVTFTSGG